MSEYAMVGAFVCCILVIVGIALGVKVSQNVQESCSSAPFHDLPNEFREEEQYFSTRSRSKLFALYPNNTQLGSFTTRPAAFKTSYSYRDFTDNVVAEAKKVHCRLPLRLIDANRRRLKNLLDMNWSGTFSCFLDKSITICVKTVF